MISLFQRSHHLHGKTSCSTLARYEHLYQAERPTLGKFKQISQSTLYRHAKWRKFQEGTASEPALRMFGRSSPLISTNMENFPHEKFEKCAKILADLQTRYPSPDAPLDHTDPFFIIDCRDVFAQTTDKKVNEVTPGLFALAKTPKRCSTSLVL